MTKSPVRTSTLAGSGAAVGRSCSGGEANGRSVTNAGSRATKFGLTKGFRRKRDGQALGKAERAVRLKFHRPSQQRARSSISGMGIGPELEC